MLLKVQLILAVMVFALLMSPPAQAGRRDRVSSQVSHLCDASKPLGSVRALTMKTSYVRTKSAFNLTTMHGAGGRSITLGLGGGEIGYETKAKFKIAEQNGQACVSVHQVRVEFYAKPQIHIASNFERGTCEYNAVLGHEQKHIRTLRRFHKEYAQKLKAKMPQILSRVRPSGKIPASQVEQAQEKILSEISAQVEDFLNKSVKVLGRRQKDIDNPREYKAVAAMCKNWDKKLTSGY